MKQHDAVYQNMAIGRIGPIPCSPSLLLALPGNCSLALPGNCSPWQLLSLATALSLSLATPWQLLFAPLTLYHLSLDLLDALAPATLSSTRPTLASGTHTHTHTRAHTHGHTRHSANRCVRAQARHPACSMQPASPRSTPLAHSLDAADPLPTHIFHPCSHGAQQCLRPLPFPLFPRVVPAPPALRRSASAAQ